MSLPPFRHSMVKIAVGNYIESKRPPERVRDIIDLSYQIDESDVVIHDIRPHDNDPNKKVKKFRAKASFDPHSQSWRVYWMDASGEWQNYQECKSVSNIAEFIDLLKADSLGLFWG